MQGIPSLVLLVSAEAPGRLARRLRELADNPVMQGKLLAIWPLAGPLREDLPVSLLAKGTLAGLGVAETSPVGLHQVAKDLAVLAGGLANVDAAKQRVEDLPGSLVWFF